MTSRCSGATASDTRSASSTDSQATAKPLAHAGAATAFVGRFSSCASRAALILATIFSAPALPDPSDEKATTMGRATTSCSACASMSAATVAASAVSSQMTSTSDGPAIMSMPTRADVAAQALAAVTHALPGPQSTSARGTPSSASAPVAMAAMAWAPPTATSTSAPATWAAASVTGRGLGVATTTVLTPAARAVTAVMSTELGSG
mmetsp:Transcript_21889/g.75488  ORF Transcript_21889/g.75488 Transcript_21889/m.75488 type:complete len:206 (-) Transcript_21889:470-1087(-)